MRLVALQVLLKAKCQGLTPRPLDTTLAGSRNAITPLFIWYALKTVKYEGFRKIIANCFETAEYAINRFAELGIKAWQNKNSVTVVFPRPTYEIATKWQLAVQNDISHIITMPHVEKRQIDAFMQDIKEQGLYNRGEDA